MQYLSKGNSSGVRALAAAAVVIAIALSGCPALAEIPQQIAVPGEIPASAIHAEGAQIYQCEANSENRLIWRFREPIATLMVDGNPVGRHYAALHWDYVDASTPVWEHKDGSAVKARVVARVAGVTSNDIPWLKLRVVSQTGNGTLYGATHVQRINTQGGMVEGPCEKAGSYLSVPYSADYVFWRAD
jgi:Protein of unknown function (DUF3455)